MTPWAIGLCVICQALIVTGQLLLKRGITGSLPRFQYFVMGILCLTVWFFLWLGLMGKRRSSSRARRCTCRVAHASARLPASQRALPAALE